VVITGTTTSSGKYIQPPGNHYSRDKEYFGIKVFSNAVFVSPSFSYASHACYSVRFQHDGQKYSPVLECSVSKDEPGSITKYPSTVSTFALMPGDNTPLKEVEWRITNPGLVELTGIFFIQHK